MPFSMAIIVKNITFVVGNSPLSYLSAVFRSLDKKAFSFLPSTA